MNKRPLPGLHPAAHRQGGPGRGPASASAFTTREKGFCSWAAEIWGENRGKKEKIMSNGAALYSVSPSKREKETNLLLTQCNPGGGDVSCRLLGTGQGAGCLGWVVGVRAGWADIQTVVPLHLEPSPFK